MTWDKFKEVYADLARPTGLYALGLSLSIATVVAVFKARDATDAAVLIGAAGAIFGTAYGFRSNENIQTAKHAAEIEIAKTKQDQSQ